MTEGGKLASVLLAMLALGVGLIAYGLGWTGRVALLGVGLALTRAAVALLAALIRR